MQAQRLVFSSPGAAGGAAEARRFARWWEEYHATVGGTELVADRDMPFVSQVEYISLGAVRLGRWTGSISRVERRKEHAARDCDDRFTFSINRSGDASQAQTESRSATIPPSAGFLGNYARSGFHACCGWYNIIALHIPRRCLLELMPHGEDAVGTVIPSGNPALRVLASYAGSLLADRDIEHPAVLMQAGQHLLDLAVLAVGTDRDNAEIARLRGLSAAHLAAVLRRIRADYADPEISPETVATRVGISTRYLHKLLHETGVSFAERVQELRLARAFALLCGEGGTVRKISDAAYEAGFSDLSHFNRMFRRKYGLTPTAARGRDGLAAN